jgi:hypothetical protein
MSAVSVAAAAPRAVLLYYLHLQLLGCVPTQVAACTTGRSACSIGCSACSIGWSATGASLTVHFQKKSAVNNKPAKQCTCNVTLRRVRAPVVVVRRKYVLHILSVCFVALGI